MTIQEFEEKQRLYEELQELKKQHEEIKELLECVSDPSWQDNALLLQINKSFAMIISHIANSDACCTEEVHKVIFDSLTNMATIVCHLEEKKYKQLLTEFEK